MTKRWLLIPMQPTPNGRLHIGHGGGPYLRADVIARMLRRDGHNAHIVTGSDSYENWVQADGIESGRTPEQTCARFHEGIQSDLKHLGVGLDMWINPLHVDHRRAYIETNEHLLNVLQDTGTAVLQTEQVPVGAESGRELLGVWIAGACPTCGAPAGGNSCTACSDSFTPEQLTNPHSRLSNEPISWEERSSWFAQIDEPDKLLAKAQDTGLPEQFLTPAQTFLRRVNPRIRLSQPSDWGIPSHHVPPGSVLANTYFGYSLYCAQVYGHNYGGGNALHRESEVTVLGLFGTDNSIAGLVAPHALTVGTEYKPFDYTVVNHMLHWQGSKCSTSKRHGIWIADLIDNTTVTTDEIRYVLARMPLDREVCNLDTTTVVATINQLRRWRATTLRDALVDLHTEEIDTDVMPKLIATLDRQQRHLMPPNVDLRNATEVLNDWILRRPHGAAKSHRAAWLVGTALLAAPITPMLASQLWTELGLPGDLVRSVLDQAPRLSRAAGNLDLTAQPTLTTAEVTGVAK